MPKDRILKVKQQVTWQPKWSCDLQHSTLIITWLNWKSEKPILTNPPVVSTTYIFVPHVFSDYFCSKRPIWSWRCWSKLAEGKLFLDRHTWYYFDFAQTGDQYLMELFVLDSDSWNNFIVSKQMSYNMFKNKLYAYKSYLIFV